MREGEDRVIIYLDRKAELAIAEEAFQRHEGDVLDESTETRRTESATRFNGLANKEFGVLANDTSFLLEAAQKVLAKNNVRAIVQDTIAGRRSAASRISERLSNRIFAYPVPVSNKN